MSAADDNRLRVLSAVFEGLSGDKFLAFMDRWLRQYVEVSSPRYLDWGPSPAEGTSSGGGGWGGFTHAHHAVFTDYGQCFESRLGSVLRQHASALLLACGDGGSGDSEVSRCVLTSPPPPQQLQSCFFALCAAVVQDEDDDHSNDSALATKRRKQVLAEGEVLATPSELCHVIIDLVAGLGDFASFAAMMHRRQEEHLMCDDEG